MNKTIYSLALMIMLFNSGCSTQTANLDSQKKYEDLPSWVLNDNSLYTGIGSAKQKGQSFTSQTQEAVTLAKMSLSQKISTHINSTVQIQAHSTQSNLKEDKFEKSMNLLTTQNSSNILNGAFVSKTYIAKDGELFVQVSIDSIR